MKLDGTDAKQVTHFKSMSWAPYEHPSGEYFLFASNKLGFENFEIFIVDKAGAKEPVRITYSDGFDGLPVPSPDGKQIAFTSSRSGGGAGQIFLAQWNHEAAMKALAAAPPRKSSSRSGSDSRFRPCCNIVRTAPSSACAASPPLGTDGDGGAVADAPHVEALAAPGSRGGWPGRRARSKRPTIW